MKRYNTADLRKLEIVNLCDGSFLGCATDFEFEMDHDCGKLLAIVIGGSSGFFGIGKRDDIIIPWRLIECIGEDTILVRMNPNELAGCTCPKKPSKKKVC